jgi:hypothetical protein
LRGPKFRGQVTGTHAQGKHKAAFDRSSRTLTLAGPAWSGRPADIIGGKHQNAWPHRDPLDELRERSLACRTAHGC